MQKALPNAGLERVGQNHIGASIGREIEYNALLAVGLVLIYMSNRVVNFAHGEIGAFAVALMLTFTQVLHWGYWFALLAALAPAAAAEDVLWSAVVLATNAKQPKDAPKDAAKPPDLPKTT